LNYGRLAILAAILLYTPLSRGADAVVQATFPAAGISTVVLRAGTAVEAAVTVGPAAVVQIAGTASGGAKGHHSTDPNWKETQAADWGLGFLAQAFGSTLVVSTQNETLYIHHHYIVERIQLQVPPNVKVVREARALSGDGKPDLSAP
jgi:hypothetical protein